jgi:protein-S-isoprenylcysteine O-methyltransferase Ste14
LTSLAIYVFWLTTTFGVRMLVAFRRTGDSRFRGISGRPPSLEWCAGVLFVVALALGVLAPVAAISGLQPLVSSPAMAWSGLVIASCGVMATFVAQMSMGDAWRIGVDESERTDLVTEGAFGAARNPIYTAMLTTAVGLVAMVPNAIAFAGFLALLVALEIQVRHVEEPYLRRLHGAGYDVYASRVGRFLPGIGRIRTAVPVSEGR